MEPSMRVELAGVWLKNPVMTASGTFGSGREYASFLDLNDLGAVVTKGVSSVPWEGNGTARIAETPSGMLNAIGLQNPGVDVFVKRDIPYLSQFDTRVIVNVCGHSLEEYVDCVKKLSGESRVDFLEINISCPNVREGGLAFGTDPRMVEKVTGAVKEAASVPVIMKLSPNVTDITEIALAAESGGADVLSMINTLTGMKIDIRKKAFALCNRTGGLSGPAIHPVAVRAVWQCHQAVKIPIIGMGGIFTWEDAVEMMMAGATAVSIGTALFRDPQTPLKVLEGMKAYLRETGESDVRQLVGCVS